MKDEYIAGIKENSQNFEKGLKKQVVKYWENVKKENKEKLFNI